MIPTSLLAAVMLAIAPVPVDPLVSVAWLNQHLHDRDVVIVQVGRKSEYDKEHIAGTRHFGDQGLEQDMSGPSMDMTLLPPVKDIVDKLAKAGVSNGSQVIVVFTRTDFEMATRTIFLMRYVGLENVALLDGGFDAWKRASLPVTAALPTIAPGRVVAAPVNGAGVDASWVQAHLTSPRVRVVDARDPASYNSTSQGSMKMAPGHIPGAKNIPFSSLTDDSGLFLSRSAIEAKFRAAGVQRGDTVLAYCHVGIQATAVVFGARLIGQPVKMYVGSFHDWSDRKLPTESGKP